MPTPTKIILTRSEGDAAQDIARRRQLGATGSGKRDRFGAQQKDGMTLHLVGALGEAAVAKALGIAYEGTVDTYQEGYDVLNYEVRTRTKDSYDLIVRPGDKNDAPYILVTQNGTTFNVWGWILGRDAKHARYLQDFGGRPPAYFVPKSDLLPLTDLPGRP